MYPVIIISLRLECDWRPSRIYLCSQAELSSSHSMMETFDAKSLLKLVHGP